MPQYGNVIEQADIWIPTSVPLLNEHPVNFYGSRQFQMYLHEIGHALGLEHGGGYEAGDVKSYDEDAEHLQDTLQFSVMSYFSERPHGVETGADYVLANRDAPDEVISNPQTPMLHDVAAIQAMYGADMTTRWGDTVYGFNSSFGETGPGSVYNFNINQNPVLTIYDAGGTDTLDVSGFTQNQIIDLRPGHYSSIGALKQNVAMAFNTEQISRPGIQTFNPNAVIENAVGGSGEDTIYGNDVGNGLNGNGGEDWIEGGKGDDTINGGPGGDWMWGGADSDTYVVDNNEDYVVEFVLDPVRSDWVDTVVSTSFIHLLTTTNCRRGWKISVYTLA
jgi:Ca2+-binding RTX toxin-like protein